jgi:broad specificity phosphatase PhoE
VSRLHLVRHAQASIHSTDYDQLSARGHLQARKLGASWAERGVRVDAIYVGPQKRHRQTEELVRAGAAEGGLELPPPSPAEELGEIDATPLSNQAMARIAPSCPNLREQLTLGKLEEDGQQAMRHFAGVFEKLMVRWTAGEFDEIESYEAFSQRIHGGIARIMRAEGRGKQVAVFTSGGVISVAARLALGVPADKTIALMFALHNASVTELRYTENRLSLARFNDVGYLPAELITGI